MRTLCPNLDNEDGLETVLEVPIPEESFDDSKINHNITSWLSMKSWIKPHSTDQRHQFSDYGGRNAEIQLLLGVVGAPLVPLPLSSGHPTMINPSIQDHPIEASMAKYIVQQYIAAAGGERAMNLVDSMCAVGKVKMVASEFIAEDGITMNCNGFSGGGKAMKAKSVRNGGGEMGGFVLWQKRPDLWSLELVVSGYKISAGSDGKVAWRQTPWHHSHASRGPPRPLRRSLQGLDPKSTANLFTNSICIGEKTINGEDCFVLKLEAKLSTLKIRSSNNVEIKKHTIWGYFSQRTGLLYQLKDSHLIRIKSPGSDSVFWETTMESLVEDYRTIDGVNIAHGGQTSVSLFRFGEDSESHSQTKMEEVWTIEEVDFNIKGLSKDCFLPPSDLKKEEDQPIVHASSGDKFTGSARLASKSRGNSSRFGVPKIVAIDSHGLGDM